MNSNTILSLYNWEYTCVEKPASKDKRYTDNLYKCISIEETLEKILDAETYSLIEKLIKHHNLFGIVELEETFI